MISAKEAHKLADDSQKTFYNDTLSNIETIIKNQCMVGGYKVKYPVTFKICLYSDDAEENEFSRKQEQARKQDVEHIIKTLQDAGYAVSFNQTQGSKEIPIYADDSNGNECICGSITEVTYLYELIISW